MSTGNFESWAGTISEIGPIYPLVGSEGLLAIAGVVFWLWWHIRQVKIEEKEFEEDMKRYADKETLLKMVSKEDPEHP